MNLLSQNSVSTRGWKTSLQGLIHEAVFLYQLDLTSSEEEGELPCSVFFGSLEASQLNLKTTIFNYGPEGFVEPNRKFNYMDDYRYRFTPPRYDTFNYLIK